MPPGPHGLPPELVARNQRERLIAAMAEVCGERGYIESSVAEVARRAGVSTASFYRHFEDKRECMLTSFEELFGRLLGGLERACEMGGNQRERVRAGAGLAARILASDPPTARLLSTEILAVGPEGVRLQHEAIGHLASLLRAPPANKTRVPQITDPDPAWAAAAAMTSLAARSLAQGDVPVAAEFEAIAEALASNGTAST